MKKSGEHILKLRKLTGLTQAKFANRVNVTRPYISQLENDGVDISLGKFISWCHLLEVDPRKVFS